MAKLVDAISVVVETQSGICAARQKERTDRPLQVRILYWLLEIKIMKLKNTPHDIFYYSVVALSTLAIIAWVFAIVSNIVMMLNVN